MNPANDPLYLAEPDPGGVSPKVLVPQAIERRWSHVLTLNERVLLMRLQDMTVQWGEASVPTSITEIVEGRKGKGEWRMGKIGYSVATCERAMEGLRKHGLITTERRVSKETKLTVGLTVTVNIELILAPWEIEVVAPSASFENRKRDRKSAETAENVVPHSDGAGPSERGSRSLTQRVQVPHTEGHYTKIPTQLSSTNIFHEDDADASDISADAAMPNGGLPLFADGTVEKISPVEKSPVSEIDANVAKVRNRTAARRATALQHAFERIGKAKPWEPGKKRLPSMIRADDLWIVWCETMIMTSMEMVNLTAWTKRERGIAMELFNRWAGKAERANPNGTFAEFLQFVASDWKGIMAREFGWMTKSPPPALPEIGFVQRFFREFENDFVNRERKRVLDRLDIGEIEELVAKGNSFEAALEIVAERKVRGKVRREVERAKRIAPAAKAPPPARQRVRSTPQQAEQVQPVATDKGLNEGDMRATSVTRQKMASRSASEWERDLWGSKD